MQEEVFSAIGVSPGIALGRIRILATAEHAYIPENRVISKEQVEHELVRLKDALGKTHSELDQLQKELAEKLNTSEANIFDAHILMLEDPAMVKEVEQYIGSKLIAAECAYAKVMERYINTLAAIDDPYIKERAVDIRDVGSRVLMHLQASGTNTPETFSGEPAIVLARDLTPSDTARLGRKDVLAFVTETGSRTSHSAVLARSMQIPALVGIPAGIFEKVSDGDIVIVDGGTGRLIVNPSKESYELFLAKFEEEKRILEQLDNSTRLRPETTDGFSVQLSANMEDTEDLEQIKRYAACGIGLFRTEFLFMNRSTPPDEETQLEVYRKLLTACGDDPVVIRTLDVGGDKMADSIQSVTETNPALGLRGVRLGLFDRPDILRSQIRALLRAAQFGNLHVMIPMISDISEIKAVKKMIAEEVSALKAAKIKCADRLFLGAMIETPAAALCCDTIACEVDFFSIGSNDMVQYVMCVDRTNEKVAHMYNPAHPAVLKILKTCIETAREHRIGICLCGEIAGDPRFTALLIGLGLRELSMATGCINMVRHVTRKLSVNKAEMLAYELLAGDSAEENMKKCEDFLRNTAPEIYSLVTGNL